MGEAGIFAPLLEICGMVFLFLLYHKITIIKINLQLNLAVTQKKPRVLVFTRHSGHKKRLV